MRVAVTGATGFIGSALVRRLRATGHEPVALSRDPARVSTADASARRFDPNDPAPQPHAFDGVDAVVHLAGESVAGRWTAEKKRRIRDSRVAGTRTLVDSLLALERPPAILVSASATGFYGDRGDEMLDESASAGDDFLAQVCIDWEAQAQRAASRAIRVAMLRTGIALGAGGALAAMLPPFRFGLGGPFGSGKQYVPWIHLDDLTRLYCFALENASLTGAVNAVAPDQATSARFARAVGSALHRPAILPAPGFALRIVLGEFAETLLTGQRVVPASATAAGFTWEYPQLDGAVARAIEA